MKMKLSATSLTILNCWKGEIDMTEQEAIGILKSKLTCMGMSDKALYSEEGCNRDCDSCEYMYGQGTWDEYRETLEMAIQSLEKQIPKKPIPGGLYSCPNCEKLLGYGAFEPKGLYCKHCGQKLDWGDKDAVD